MENNHVLTRFLLDQSIINSWEHLINYQENVERESDKKRCNTEEREGGQHQDHLLETLRTLITLKSAISFSSTLAVKK